MKVQLPLASRLALLLALFAALLIASIGTLAYYVGRDALEKAIIAGLVSTRMEKEAALSSWVEEGRRHVATLAASPQLCEETASLVAAIPGSTPSRAIHDRLVAELAVWAGPGHHFASLFVMHPESAEVIVSTDAREEAKFREDQPYLVNGKSASYVQTPYYSLTTMDSQMTASAPIRAADGRLLGILAAHLNLDEVHAIITRRTGLDRTDDAFLVNTSHLFVTQPRLARDRAVLQRGAYAEPANRALAGQTGEVLANDYRGVPVIAAYAWLPELQLGLVVKVDQAEAFVPVRRLSHALLLPGGLACLVAVVVSLVVARVITKPLRALQIGAARIGAGELTYRVQVQARDEISQLAQAFNQMAEDLQATTASRDELNAEIVARQRAEETLYKLNAELEQRVIERTAQLEAANQELEAFSYSVSHDLRAPLRGIDGWSLALVEDYGGQLDAQAQGYLHTVRAEAQRMGRLIDDLLQLSRVTRAEVRKSVVDLSALAQTIIARLRAAQPERQMEVTVQPGLTVWGDRTLLEVLLTNLLDNACKFTTPRHPARIEVGQGEVEGQTAFFVRDNGVGFDMAFAHKLFGAFQRLHKASDFSGTGIGLATVQRIVRRHGGRVWAQAQVDQGATFCFTLGEGTR